MLIRHLQLPAGYLQIAGMCRAQFSHHPGHVSTTHR